LSSISGIFFLYLLLVRPYDSVIDNIGAILSSSIVVFFVSVNLSLKISPNSSIALSLYDISSMIIIPLLVISCIITLIRFFIFWHKDKEGIDHLLG
jgi:hypothetical protein